jgi:tetratricopeptide (TPR) repeat protein
MRASWGAGVEVVNPAEPETAMRESLDAAAAAGDYRTALVAAGRLGDLLKDSGRLVEAVDLAWQRIRYTQQAGLGPWTELNSRVGLLQVLNRLYQGDRIQAGRILAEVTRLRDHMATLPATPGPNEAVTAWNTREGLLDTGRNAAVQLGRWTDALDLNALVVASMRNRNALATTITRARYNDYAPLLRLGRTDEALALLQDCLRTFQDASDDTMIGNALSALADTENFRDHGEAAISLERDALRYRYRAGDVAGIATSYHNLGIYRGLYSRQFARAVASHLAAALIGYLTGAGDVHGSAPFAATGLRELGGNAVLPTSVADLDRKIGDIPGTDLPRLIVKLSPDPEDAKQALHDLIAQAMELAAT